jgi:hypothetical protein
MTSMIRSAVLITLLLLTSNDVCPAAPPQTSSVGEAGTLWEANRALEEELKLAARPQLYLVLDFPEGSVLVKGRGLELHRLRLVQWEVSSEIGLTLTFRLQARPPVSRPKLAPGEDPAETVINLDDMPAEYVLVFEPNLIVSVAPPASEQPLLWARSRLREWGSRFGRVAGLSPFRVRLTLAKDDVRSLAWSVVEGMPLIIRRYAPTPNERALPPH